MTDSDTTSTSTQIKLPAQTASNVHEVARHMEAHNDTDNPTAAAFEMMCRWYAERHSADFREKPGGQLIFIGNSHTPDLKEMEQSDPEEHTEDTDNGDDGLSFMMGDGPP